jgi:hypothetical protein
MAFSAGTGAAALNGRAARLLRQRHRVRDRQPPGLAVLPDVLSHRLAHLLSDLADRKPCPATTAQGSGNRNQNIGSHSLSLYSGLAVLSLRTTFACTHPG